MKYNQNAEQIARDKIDKILFDAGWVVQSKKDIDTNEIINELNEVLAA